MLASRCKRVHIVLFYYFSLLLGLTSIQYDIRTQKVIRTRFHQIYSVCVNLLVLGLVPFAFAQSFRPLSVFEQNPLVRYLNYAINSTNFLVAALSVGLRWYRDRRLYLVFKELYHLQCDYFKHIKIQPHIERYCDRLFYLKYYVMVFQTLSHIHGMLIFMDTIDERKLFYCIIYVNLMNLHRCIMFLYYVLLQHLCKRFLVINQQLENILEQLKRWTSVPRYRQLAAEVDTLAKLHATLYRLVMTTTKIYAYQIFLTLSLLIVQYVIIGYFCIAYLPSFWKENDNFVLIFSIVSYIMFFVDLYLMNAICEQTVFASRQTVVALQKFQNSPFVSRVLERSLQYFALQLSRQKLRINIGGMFNLAQHSTFDISHYIMAQIIILVQFAYKSQQ